MASSSSRPDFRNSTAKSLKTKSRSLNKLIRKHLGYSYCNEQITGSVPPRIKDLIRLVKYWYEEFVPCKRQFVNEIVEGSIEKATVDAWRKYNSPKTINMAIAFKAVMVELRDHDPYRGAVPSFQQTVMETMRKPLLIDVSVTKNWCRTPVARSVQNNTPRADFRDIPAYDQSTINAFITDKLQPDESFSRPILAALDTLCRVLEGELPDVNKILKSGSMGKGTALKGKSDLDCVMILNGIRDVEDLKSKIGRLKQDLVDLLQDITVSPWKIEVKGTTPFCVKFAMKSKSGNSIVDVDLLPTFNIDEFDLKKLYLEMRDQDEETKPYYSAALSKLQIRFLKHIPSRLKDLIRLVKYWCKEYVIVGGGSRGVYPNSYLLELITINAWEKAGKQSSFNMAVGFRAVMENLRLHEKLDIVWYENYGPSQVLYNRAPRVIDPANPSNNVYDIVTEWPRVVSVVNETLKKPFVRGIGATHQWN